MKPFSWNALHIVPMSYDMRILVTGASTFFAARLIQGLGSSGVEVTAADSHWLSVGKVTRQTHRRLRIPSLRHDPQGYLAVLQRELRSRRYDLLLPTFEEALLLAEFREELEVHTRLLLPPFETMWRVHHKPSLYRLCCERAIPTPPTALPPNPRGLRHHVAALKFPVVLKLPAANNCVGRAYCDNLPELEQRYAELYERETERGAGVPFVQQKIDGDPIYTLMLCQRGQKLGEVIYRPLRTYPERGGTSAHRESIEHPAIAEQTARLAEATDWTGFLGLDFIVERTTGIPYLIDANPRANPAVHLGFLAGVDWTGMLIDLVQGKTPAPMSARPGVRNRTPLLDVGWLLEGLRPSLRWPLAAAQRVKQFLKPDWPLDSGHDFLGSSEWGCHLALACQGFGAVGKSLLSGQSLGQAMMDDCNYDPTTVRELRLSRLREAHARTMRAIREEAGEARRLVIGGA
ncbi:MAG: hypothetical protein ACKV0T_24455 [Planctomycetales bacterium]